MPPDPASLFTLTRTQWPYQSKIAGADPGYGRFFCLPACPLSALVRQHNGFRSDRRKCWHWLSIHTIEHCTIHMFDTVHNAIYGSGLFEYCSRNKAHHWWFWWHCLANPQRRSGLRFKIYRCVTEPITTVATTVWCIVISQWEEDLWHWAGLLASSMVIMHEFKCACVSVC